MIKVGQDQAFIRKPEDSSRIISPITNRERKELPVEIGARVTCAFLINGRINLCLDIIWGLGPEIEEIKTAAKSFSVTRVLRDWHERIEGSASQNVN